MKFIYLTSKKYPSTTADHLFVMSMARAFTKLLGDCFSFLVRGVITEEFSGINVISISAPSHARRLFYFFWIPFFIFIKKHNTIDTVFFSNDPNLLSLLIFWKKLFSLRYRICSDWHQLFQDSRDKYIAVNSNYLISTSEKLKELIVSASGINPNKILVSYGGVDLEKFEDKDEMSLLRLRLGLPQNDTLVGYVGFYKTMGMGKGLDTMINALNFISDTKVKMVFVGGREDEITEYKALAQKDGVLGRIIFVPAVPYEAITAYERAMDVLCIPYPNKPHFRDYGFPMKVYEYMASGKPIIYSNLPIIGEILSDCAISFTPDNSEDLGQKITDLASKKSFSIDMALKAKQKVLNYTWEKRAGHIIDFIAHT